MEDLSKAYEKSKLAATIITVPDPCRPAFLHRRANGGNMQRGKRWQNHQDRRSMILAAARKLLLEVGFSGVSFSAIAELCGVTVPTIYNVVGDRKQVMQDASAEWVQWLAAAAVVRPRASDATNLLDILYAFWVSAPNYPEFTVNAVKTSATPEAPLNGAFNNTGHGLVRGLIKNLRDREMLRPMIAVDSLAWHLTQSVHCGVCNWSYAPYDQARFRREFASGPGVMLLGALRGADAPVVERALKAIAYGGALH